MVYRSAMISRAIIIIESRDDLRNTQKKLRKIVVDLLNDENPESTPIMLDLLEIAEDVNRVIIRLTNGD